MVVASLFCKKVIGPFIPRFFTGNEAEIDASISAENHGFGRFQV
jgi:hypothetical protein